MSDPEPQSARAVLMVRPARFGFNPQTAGSNVFQRELGPAGDAGRQSQVLGEFDGLATALDRAGVQVVVAEDSAVPIKPDAVFPITGSASIVMARSCCTRCLRSIGAWSGVRIWSLKLLGKARTGSQERSI